MKFLNYTSLLGDLYQGEEFLGGVLSQFGIAFAPVYVAGDVGAPGVYNVPDVTPVTTQTVTYTAAGVRCQRHLYRDDPVEPVGHRRRRRNNECQERHPEQI